MIVAPMRTPATVPCPPISEVPPMTAAAMASNSMPRPAFACAERKRATKRTPVTALSAPEST